MANTNNIKLDSPALEGLITKLENDNIKLDTIIKDMGTAIRYLDETKWKSREKKQLDALFLPFMNKIESNFLNYLMEVTELLKKANLAYQNQEINISKTVNQVDAANEIDVL